MTIFSKTKAEYQAFIFSHLGRGKRHAGSLYSHFFRKGSFEGIETWVEPQALSLVNEMIVLSSSQIPYMSMVREEGNVSKYLLAFSDGKESESVLIPMQSGITLCISSQIGCKKGCAFCQTAKMGLVRNLTSEEIVGQVFFAKHVLKQPVRNIVFMGMGEPFDNYEEVMQAIAVLTDPAGLGFGHRRITISTSGRVDNILRFAKEAHPALHLAVSVNAPNDAIRSKLMPVNREWDMAALKSAMQIYCSHGKREILAEYVLIAGITDSIDCAEQLAEYLQGLRVKVNLIPYNPQLKGRFMPPDPAVVDRFAAYLRGKGYQTLLRTTKGDKIMAACGQLGKSRSCSSITPLQVLSLASASARGVVASGDSL